MRKKIEGLAIPHLGNAGNVVAASFGLTCVRVDPSVDQHAVYVPAYNASYEANSTGRNRVVRSMAPA